MGASDYIKKPFSQKLLNERIRTVLRIHTNRINNNNDNNTKTNKLIKDNLILDEDRQLCFWKENEIELTVAEFNLIKSLAQYPGVVKDRNQLMDAMYGENIYVDDRTIDSHIKRLRKKNSDLTINLLIKLELDMGLGILGVIKRSIFYLPNYSLSFQLVIINLGIIISGLIFLTLFNYFLISTNKFFENRNKNILNNLNNISKYLENTSILRVPIFQYDYRCRYIEDIKTYKENCDTQSNINPIELSEPELEKYSTEQFIFQNYGDKDFKIRIFNDNLIKIADSSNLFSNTDVEEINLSEKNRKIIMSLKLLTNFILGTSIIFI